MFTGEFDGEAVPWTDWSPSRPMVTPAGAGLKARRIAATH